MVALQCICFNKGECAASKQLCVLLAELHCCKKTFSLDMHDPADCGRRVTMRKVLTRSFLLFLRSRQIVVGAIAVAVIVFTGGASNGQVERPPAATVHWQGVPLSETLDRLKQLFNDPVFVDRRVDPSVRVTLDMSASSAEHSTWRNRRCLRFGSWTARQASVFGACQRGRAVAAAGQSAIARR